jgi:hypothetical protein
MTPLPTRPVVIILVDEYGQPMKIASNIAPLPELEIKISNSPWQYNYDAAGKPFNQYVIQ